METKTVAASLAVVSLLFTIGVIFAAPGWYGKEWETAGQNATRPDCGIGMNASQANPAELEQFEQAVEAGDYQTAKQLHESYGFGGLLFDKLNETTFAKYSQIYALANELREELGLTDQSGIGPRFGELMGRHGPAQGMHSQPGNRMNIDAQNNSQRQQFEAAAISACEDKSEGDSCTMQSPGGEQTNTCKARNETLLCLPEFKEPMDRPCPAN